MLPAVEASQWKPADALACPDQLLAETSNNKMAMDVNGAAKPAVTRSLIFMLSITASLSGLLFGYDGEAHGREALCGDHTCASRRCKLSPLLTHDLTLQPRASTTRCVRLPLQPGHTALLRLTLCISVYHVRVQPRRLDKGDGREQCAARCVVF